MTDGEPTGSPVRRRVLSIVVPLVIWVVIAVAGWLRLTPQVRNTLWAEDGKVFLGEQYRLGVAGALFHDYAGYLHVVPRLVVAVASHIGPIDRLAVTVSALCVVVAAAVGAAVWVLTAGVIRSVVARLLLALIPALVPLGPMEIQANAANLHWFLMFLMPFALFTPVRSWSKGILLGIATLLAGLTEIQIVAFFPLFFVGIRNRYRWPIILGSVIGGAAQVVTTLTHPRAAATVPHETVADMVLGYAVQPFAGSFTWSMPAVGRAIAENGVWVVLLPLVVAAVLTALGLWLGAPASAGCSADGVGLGGGLVRGGVPEPEPDARVRPLRRGPVARELDVPLQRGRVDVRHRCVRRARRHRPHPRRTRPRRTRPGWTRPGRSDGRHRVGVVWVFRVVGILLSLASHCRSR